MEFLHKSEKKRIIDEIRKLENYNKTDSQTIERFKLMTGTDFTKNQIEKLFIKIQERKEVISDLQERFDNIDQGVYDYELEQEYKKMKNEILNKCRDSDKKKADIKTYKDSNRIKSQEFFQSDRKSDKSERFCAKDIERTYDYFLRINNSIPEYMLKKLANMPNNKGYIWKGIYCYGELEAEIGKPVTIFEKTRSGQQLIHEWTDTYYKIYYYDKIGKSSKKHIISDVRYKNRL